MTVYFRARICQTYIGTQDGVSHLSLNRKFLLSTFSDTRKSANQVTCHTRHMKIRDFINRDFIMSLLIIDNVITIIIFLYIYKT
jgi:hypothetical protein